MSESTINDNQIVALAGPTGTSNNYILSFSVLGTTEVPAITDYNYVGDGTLILGGIPIVNQNYSYVADGVLILGSSALVKNSQNENYTSSGSLTLSGSSIAGFSNYRYTTSGSLVLSSDYKFELNYIGLVIGNLILGGSSNYSYNTHFYISNARLNPYVTSSFSTSFIYSLQSTWNLQKNLEKDLTFLWDIGEENLYWYTVEGICNKNAGCTTTGIPSASGGRIYSRTLAARNLSDLCFKLSSLNINYPVDWPITKILRGKKPVYTDTINFDNDGNEYKVLEDNQIVKITSSEVNTYYNDNIQSSQEYDGKFTLILPDSRKIVKNFENGILKSVSVIEVDKAVKNYNQESVALIKTIPSSLISSNYQISKQIENLGLNDNTMVEQVYCHIPECLIYCIDEDLMINIGCETLFTDGFYEIVASGGLNISGKSICVNNNAPSFNGGLILGGSSNCNANSYAYSAIASGSLVLNGQGLVKYSKWSYIPNNHSLDLSGESITIGKNYHYTSSGSLILSGVPILKRRFVYIINNPKLYLGGDVSSGLNSYKYTPKDGLLLYGFVPYVSNSFVYTPNSGLVLSNSFIVKSDKRYYVPNSGLIISGIAKVGFRQTMSGGFSLSGTSLYNFNATSEFSGSLVLSGNAFVKSSNFKYSFNGGVVLGGTSDTNIIDDTNLMVNIGSTVTLDVFETVLPEIYGSDSLVELSTENDFINYYDCGCAPLPVKMYLENNLQNSNIFKLFLNRNNITFSNNLLLTYSSNSNSWRNSSYFNSANEKWNVSYDWFCDTFNSMNVWNFSITVSRILNGNKFLSKITLLFDKTDPCNNDKIDFYFVYDTNNRNLLLPKGVVLIKSDIKDEIGLFKDTQWLKSPYLKIRLSESEVVTSVNKKDIYSIFPNG